MDYPELQTWQGITQPMVENCNPAARKTSLTFETSVWTMLKEDKKQVPDGLLRSDL